MKSTGLWIADPDDAYGKAFMEYVNLKESHLYQVRICTDREALIKALAGEDGAAGRDAGKAESWLFYRH